MKLKILIGLAITVAFGWRAGAQIYDTNGDYVQTFAGSGFAGYVDGVGQLTMFTNPNSIVADSYGNLFVWDSGNFRIRKITTNGTVTTFAGGGSQTTGVGTNVVFNLTLVGMTMDSNNTIWMLFYPSYLYEVTSAAVVTSTNLSGFSGNGICVDSLGNIYISGGNKIYRYSTNAVLSVFAGSGNTGYADGSGIFTAFNVPASMAADVANNIYVWDSGNGLIRRIDQNQNVTTIAGKYSNQSPQVDGRGTNASFTATSPLYHVPNTIQQMCCDDSGDLFLASGNCIRKIDATSNVVTLAGSFTQTGYTNGSGNLARFDDADGVCVSGGTIYVADSSNQRIRSITNNPTPQVVSGANLGIGTFAGVTITGIVGRTYQIQSSPDLSAWTTRTTILLNSSPYLWIDQNPVNGNKFYRALLLP